MDIRETLVLDSTSLNQVQALAKEGKRTFQDEAVYLLEKGIRIAETAESQKQTERTLCKSKDIKENNQ